MCWGVGKLWLWELGLGELQSGVGIVRVGVGVRRDMVGGVGVGELEGWGSQSRGGGWDGWGWDGWLGLGELESRYLWLGES